MRGYMLAAALFLAQLLHAQSLTRNNLYPYNPGFANPAATGLTNCLELSATDMHQWIGIPGAPSVQSLSIQKGRQFSKTKKHGLGINLVRDINGPTKDLNGEAVYSFHILMGRNRLTWLSFGLSGSIGQLKLDEKGFSPIYDPRINGGVESELVYNASTGIYLYNKKYFAGIALYNLLPVNSSLGRGYGREQFYLSFQGGYLFDSRRLPVKIQTSVQGCRGTDIMQFDLNNKIVFENNLWTGLTLRKYLGSFETASQDAIIYIGYNWTNLNFSYSYTFDINGTQFHHFGTHQFALGYRICPDKYSCPTYK